MGDEEKELLRLVWTLWEKHQALLQDTFPTMNDIVRTFQQGFPTREQVAGWSQGYHELYQKLDELVVQLESLRQSVDPLICYDA